MYSIELCASKFKLTFKQVNKIDWYRLLLVTNTEIIELGAENLKIIIQKLLLVFDNVSFQQCDVNHEEEPYIWVMSLSEKHASIYSKKVLRGIELRFEDCQGNKIAIYNLSNKECRDWRLKLEEIQEKL